MRSIKFRGKRIDNGEWVYGCLVNNLWVKSELTDTPGEEVCHIISGDDVQDWSELEDEENAPEVIPESIGQYTGQKCGDVEWYEGDIIRINENDPEDVGIYVCTWIHEWCMFALLNVEMGEYAKYLAEGADSLDTTLYWTYPIDTYKTEDGKYEVIGDRHSNPELLSK